MNSIEPQPPGGWRTVPFADMRDRLTALSIVARDGRRRAAGRIVAWSIARLMETAPDMAGSGDFEDGAKVMADARVLADLQAG